MYGFFVPPMQSFQKTKVMGSWWKKLSDHHAKLPQMTQLLYYLLRKSTENNKELQQIILLSGGDGYSALHNLMRSHHPILIERRVPKSMPKQFRTGSFYRFVIRFRQFLIDEASVGRTYHDYEALDAIVGHLCPDH